MLLLLGPPGAGKSLQGQMLEERRGFKWLSLGSIIRKLNDKHLKDVMKKGDLVDYSTANKILQTAFEKYGSNKVVLDGFPRSQEQAKWLINNEYFTNLKLVIVFDISDEEIYKRLALRGREDDTKDSIAERIDKYNKSIESILMAFDSANVATVHINAEGGIDQVYDRIEEQVSKCGII
jgi:adenylate kinase family enzyme